ncbi:MAG: hypothetical protein KGY99_06145 [Phycisphaerae bacterium]|nr:hypothetical protein [Phycisphaerae bacterium]
MRNFVGLGVGQQAPSVLPALPFAVKQYGLLAARLGEADGDPSVGLMVRCRITPTGDEAAQADGAE